MKKEELISMFFAFVSGAVFMILFLVWIEG